VRNLVVHRATVLRVRVTDHGDAIDPRIARRFENRFEFTGRAAD
jgi:hypothetical protein